MPTPPKKTPPAPANIDLIALIAAQAKTHGPVFRLPALRPTWVLCSADALAVMANPDLVDKSPSIVAGNSIVRALSDDHVTVLNLTNDAEHARRRAAWLTPGGLDHAGISNALPALLESMDTTFRHWEKLRFFSLNIEARRAIWHILTRYMLGSEGGEQHFADFETMLALNQSADPVAAKRRVLDWLEVEAARYARAQGRVGVDDCLAARLAESGQLSGAEWVNEIKHGLFAGLGMWTPLAELLRQLAVDQTLAGEIRAEVAALAGNFSLAGMSKTPALLRLIKQVLRTTSSLPITYAHAKTAFEVGGVHIPADAVLIGALQAINQLPHAPDSVGVTFGVGPHICPAADMVTVTLWLFAIKLLASHDLTLLDPDDLPLQQGVIFCAPRGCFVRFARSATGFGSTPPRPERDHFPVAPMPSATPLDRATRIAIIGGGITGLTLAHELRKSGFHNVTVFERAASVGGKADTLEIDGLPYNLGAYLCHGNLGVAALAKDVGSHLVPMPNYQYWDIDHNRAIALSYDHYPQVERLRQLLAANPVLEHATGFVAAESWTYAPILNWLDAHDLGALREIGPFFTGAGYGFLEDDIPAAFFLKFAQHMIEDCWTPAGGYKRLLEKVSVGLNVQCDTEVVAVRRGTAAAGGIHLTIRRTHATQATDATQADHAAASQPQPQQFDRLILACPLEHAGQYLDLSQQEQALFARIKSHDYCTVLATLDIAQPHAPGLYIVAKHTADSAKRGHTTAFLRAFAASTVYLFFVYAEPGQGEQSILDNVRQDAAKLGGQVTQVHLCKKWTYAPHVSPHDMALGFHHRLDRMQGALGTYYAGSLLGFELTDHNVLQAQSLIQRFFAQPQPMQPVYGVANPALPAAPDSGLASHDARIDQHRTLLDILRERYESTPDALFSTFLDVKGKLVRALTYKALVERAMACALSLRDKGVQPGERVALVYPPDTDEFLIGFFGCLCARAIAVPVACPDPRKLDSDIPRFAHLIKDCDCRFALTTRAYHALALAGRAWDRITHLGAPRKDKWPSLIWLRTDGLSPLAPNAQTPIPSPAPDTVAYLQYTSGSTSDPKGVMINHRNVLHNVDAIQRQTRVGANSVLLAWVPLFHDMGLVGGPLTALYCGAHMVFFSPVSFLQNPLLWVKAMHQYRATHTEAPNFGYEFLMRHLDDKALQGIDLSCLEYVLFGGEVMRHRTFEQLQSVLYGTGFRGQLTNIFGAAEATLLLAGGGLAAPPFFPLDTHLLESKRRAVARSPDLHDTTTLIGCGLGDECSEAHLGEVHLHDVRIVDPLSKRLLPEREVGEIWHSSPSVSSGYWGRPVEQNDAIFRARIADDPAPLLTYLRTGDLGFIDRNVLYICGRLKEMMIFSGRNIHPMDIELCAMNAHPAIRQGCVVAFSVEEQQLERLVIVAELKNSAAPNPVAADNAAAAAATAIAAALADQHSLACKAVLLVLGGSLPKTSSGKLQRYRAREEYLAQRLKLIHAHESDQETNLHHSAEAGSLAADQLGDETFCGDVLATWDWLRRLLALSLHVGPEQVSSATPFAMLGIDSAQAMAMTSRLGKYMGHALSPSVLYEHPTIDALALYLCSHAGRKARVLVQLQRGDAEQLPNLFCVHPVGGSAMAYLALVQKLPAMLPVYAFENDGSEGSEVPFDDLVALAQYYVAQMQAVQGSGPYWLLGYSFGGIVAFEMARQILAAGGTIGGLFVIDAPAPLYHDHTPGPQIAAIETYDDFLNTAMLNHLLPDHLGDEERAKLRLRIEQNQTALARYRIAPNTAIVPPMTLLRASAEAAHLRAATRHPAFDRPDFGWEEAAPGSVLAIVPVPGDHFSVMNQPTQLAEVLALALRPMNGLS